MCLTLARGVAESYLVAERLMAKLRDKRAGEATQKLIADDAVRLVDDEEPIAI